MNTEKIEMDSDTAEIFRCIQKIHQFWKIVFWSGIVCLVLAIAFLYVTNRLLSPWIIMLVVPTSQSLMGWLVMNDDAEGIRSFEQKYQLPGQ